MLWDLITIIITIINFEKSKHLFWQLFLYTAGRTKDSDEKRQRNEFFQTEATNAFHLKN